MPFKGFLSLVVLLTSTLFTQTQLLRLSENCRKEKWLLSANIRVKNTLMAGRKSCAKRKSGFFLQISGEKNTLATRQLPAGRAARKRKVASFCKYQGKEYTGHLPATNQLPASYLPG